MDIQIGVGIFLGEQIEHELERQIFNLQKRVLRDRSNPFDIPESVFKGLYRLPKRLAEELLVELMPFLNDPVRITAVPNYLKLLCALHFYGHGSYQKSVGQDYCLGLSQSVVSRCIGEISFIITQHLSGRYILFPRNMEMKLSVSQRFMEKFQFPGVIGCIDCTHIAIIAPPIQHPGFAYLNRKGFHSINCQIICDSNLKILHCNARYPGSMHDSAIWNMSNVYNHMEQSYNENERGFWLLGDSGYPLQPWLLTPIEGAQENTPEARYTATHIKVRNSVERCNGVLKTRFRCLSKHRVLHYDPVKAAQIIYSCCVLHNILVAHNVEVEDNFEILQALENNQPNNEPEYGNLLALGRRTRQQLIRNYFQ